MKSEIHPTYYPSAKITCVCGKSLKIGSTVENISIEICSACHPFFTGKQKLVDTAGRVEKFQRRSAKKDTTASARLGRKVKKARSMAKKSVAKKDEK